MVKFIGQSSKNIIAEDLTYSLLMSWCHDVIWHIIIWYQSVTSWRNVTSWSRMTSQNDAMTSWRHMMSQFDVIWRHRMTSWRHLTSQNDVMRPPDVTEWRHDAIWHHSLTSWCHMASQCNVMMSYGVTAWHHDNTLCHDRIFIRVSYDIEKWHGVIWHQSMTLWHNLTWHDVSYMHTVGKINNFLPQNWFRIFPKWSIFEIILPVSGQKVSFFWPLYGTVEHDFWKTSASSSAIYCTGPEVV